MQRNAVMSIAILSAVAGLAAGLLIPAWVAPPGDEPSPPVTPSVGLVDHAASTPARHPDVVYACARCHTIPSPSLLPRDAWPGLVRDMNARIVTYNLGVPLTEAEQTEIAAYYTAHAPESLPLLSQDFAASPLAFAPSALGAGAQPGRPPAVTHLRAADLDRDGRADLIACDAGANKVLWLQPAAQGWNERILAEVTAPAHAEVVDLNGDGNTEIVVASLGSLLPTEEAVGSVVLLTPGAGRITVTPLVDQLPRTADVRPADLDGDGDTDFAVALFGMYRTGAVAWLEQTGPGRFAGHKLHQINGVSHTPVGDMNGDTRPDIVALVSQEHERVLLLTNLGGGAFETATIYQAPHSLFGCSSLELCDLDKDADLDILFTNGDLLDFNTAPKPYHGVQWLENRGQGSFAYHDILRFYGAYSVKPADLDADGDLDLVVSSMGNRWDQPRAQSLIWLENDGRQRFTPHPLATDPIYLVCTEIADLTGDGLPDIAAGSMHLIPPFERIGRISLFARRSPLD